MTTDTNVAGRYDITIEEGADFVRTYTVSGTDLTGYTIRFTVKKDPRKAALLSASTADYISITDAANGIFTVNIPSAVTDVLYWADDASHSFELETAGGVVWRLMEGKAKLTRRVNP